eukprot:scaffold125148_cov73-Cyclotella_meneghiniana.AAC.1
MDVTLGCLGGAQATEARKHAGKATPKAKTVAPETAAGNASNHIQIVMGLSLTRVIWGSAWGVRKFRIWGVILPRSSHADGLFCEGHSALSLLSPADISIRFGGHCHCNKQQQTTMPTVYHMNAAHQQGDNARAMADADAELIDAADPPQLPTHALKTPLPSPPSDASPTRSEERMRMTKDSSAAWPPPAVDSRLGRHPGNERRSQRESENQQSTTAAHSSLSVQ